MGWNRSIFHRKYVVDQSGNRQNLLRGLSAQYEGNFLEFCPAIRTPTSDAGLPSQCADVV
jgi:hypothetical protein